MGRAGSRSLISLGIALVLLALPVAVAAHEAVPYDVSCGLGEPLYVHGDVPPTVAPGATFELTDGYAEYTNPLDEPAAYGNASLTIPVPAGASGSDLVLANPDAIEYGPHETVRSRPFSASFVATGEPGAVIQFRATHVSVGSASTTGGGSLECALSGEPFASTVIEGAVEPVQTTPAFTG